MTIRGSISNCIIVTLFLFSVGSASTYYVSTTGSNSASGSKSQPFATIQKAQEVVVPGDTVLIRGGVYKITTPDWVDAGIGLYKSGSSDTKRINYWAYPGEKPVFDFSNLQIRNGDYTHGLVVTGSWLHLKGLEICNVPMNTRSNVGMLVREASNDIFELMNFHHNNGAGTFVNDSKGGGGHLYLNCDSHDNYDPTSHQGEGQNADGFGYHYQTKGKISTYRGCRAWWNSDDGWDLISQEYPVIIENSYAMGNGWAKYGTYRPSSGNGNGFKAGSSKNGVRHIVRNSVAWKNTAAGFYANHSSGGNDWINNTAYSNGSAFNLWASTWDSQGNRTDGVVLTGDKAHYMRNNIGYPNNNKYMDGVNTSHNTWDLNITPKVSDFQSVSDPSMTTTGKDLSTIQGVLGPRQSNGDLPVTDFLKLSANSQMIDKGADVGLVSIGVPDLGAYEFGIGGAMYDIAINAGPGGNIEQNPSGLSVKEGSRIEFKAIPLEGWEFASWSGDYAGTENPYTVNSLKTNLNLVANFSFVGTDSMNYEAENAKFTNALNETEHMGFSGTGYVNLENVIGSFIEFDVVSATNSSKTLTISYSNGAMDERPMSISVNGVVIEQSFGFTPTETWEIWSTHDLNVDLKTGVNTVVMTSVTANGGPNIDKIVLRDEPPTRMLVNAHAKPVEARFDGVTKTIVVGSLATQVQLFSIDGRLILNKNLRSTLYHIPMENLRYGLYILQLKNSNMKSSYKLIKQ